MFSKWNYCRVDMKVVYETLLMCYSDDDVSSLLGFESEFLSASSCNKLVNNLDIYGGKTQKFNLFK